MTSFLTPRIFLPFTATSTCVQKSESTGINLKISKLLDRELETAFDKMLVKLTFINEDLIPQKHWKIAETLVADIDLDDTDFVALTRYLKGSLWTGDKPLYEGLKAKHFRIIYNTQDLLKLRNRLVR